MLRYVLPLSVFIVLVVLFAVGLQNDPRRIPSPLIDKPLPDFSLPTLHEPGKTISAKKLAGDVMLINVWASWCASCHHEHPLLVDLHRNNVLPIYGLNYKDERDNAIYWLSHYGNPYHEIIFDEKGLTGIDLGVYGVPETYIVDQQGIIRYKHIGPITQKVLDEEMLPLIQQLQGPV